MLKLKICFLTEAELCVLPSWSHCPLPFTPAAFHVLRWWQEETLSPFPGSHLLHRLCTCGPELCLPWRQAPKFLSQQIHVWFLEAGWLPGKEGWMDGFRGKTGEHPLRLRIYDSLNRHIFLLYVSA